MKINQNLSYKLGVRALLLISILGILMALIQTVLDFKVRNVAVNQDIKSIIESIEPAASNALWALDQTHAQHVVNGLALFNYVDSVRIIDETGQTFASYTSAQSAELDQHTQHNQS